MEVRLAARVAALVAEDASIGKVEQAFVFVTVDEGDFPHPVLLSRAELSTVDEDVLVVVRGATTRSNLQRSRRATLLIVDGSATHTCKLELTDAITDRELFGGAFAIASYRVDTAGIALTPMQFVPTARLAADEQWDRVHALLSTLSGARSAAHRAGRSPQ